MWVTHGETRQIVLVTPLASGRGLSIHRFHVWQGGHMAVCPECGGKAFVNTGRAGSGRAAPASQEEFLASPDSVFHSKRSSKIY